MINRHGMSNSREWYAWTSMKQRCYNKKHHAYARYGGRGITICERWLALFSNFFDDMGECPDGMSLDRIDNSGNYEPDNCRWATRKQQQRNQRTARKVTGFGKTMTIIEWSEYLRFPYGTLKSRINRGMTLEKAILTPVKPFGGALKHPADYSNLSLEKLYSMKAKEETESSETGE